MDLGLSTFGRDNMSSLAKTVSPFAGATEHAASIRDRLASCREVTELYLHRIREHNPALHAIVSGNEDEARRTARARDEDLARGIVRGPLHGVPVTVKEAFNLAGHKTTVNLRRLRNNVASSDAFIVRRLKEAGAIVLGKTNVPTLLADVQSFGPLYPTANNPHDPTRTPGGSTGGGAAAVAAGLTALDIGSDLAGSIRLPAHFCGVFGLKPTENAAVHGDGHVPPLPGSRGGFVAMACIGPLARTMADIELAWSVINGPAGNGMSCVPQKPRMKTALSDYRIAWFDTGGPVDSSGLVDTASCGDETRDVIRAAVRRLEAAGVRSEQRPFAAAWLQEAYAVWGLLFGAIVGQDASWIGRQVLKRHFSGTGGVFADQVSGSWKAGLDLRPVDLDRALARRIDLVKDLDRRFDDCDFIIGPVAAGPAFRHNPRHRPIDLDGGTLPYLDYALPSAVIYNVCGNPALVVPAGTSADGLPIGIQIAAPHHAESELIHFGKLLERSGLVCATPAGYGDE